MVHVLEMFSDQRERFFISFFSYDFTNKLAPKIYEKSSNHFEKNEIFNKKIFQIKLFFKISMKNFSAYFPMTLNQLMCPNLNILYAQAQRIR